MKKFLLPFLAVALFVSVSSPAFATEKTRAALQADLLTNKRATFSPQLMYSDLINITDSVVTTSEAYGLNVLEGAVSLTFATHGTGQINYVSSGSANFTGTLPEATGTGKCIKLVWKDAPAGAGDTVRVATDDEFEGVLFTLSDDSAGVKGWAALTGVDNDSITLTSSTKFAAGGQAFVNICDLETGKFKISGQGNSTGTELTPFATGQRP